MGKPRRTAQRRALRANAWRHDLRRRARRGSQGEEGQALVEMAIALPVLLLLLIGIIQFGILLNKYITLTDAARAGARELAIERSNNDPCDPAIAQALIAGSNIGLQATQVTASFTTTSTTETTPSECSTGTYTYNPSYTSTTNTNTTGNENENDEATITASQPFTLSVFGLGVMHLTLTASASDAIE